MFRYLADVARLVRPPCPRVSRDRGASNGETGGAGTSCSLVFEGLSKVCRRTTTAISTRQPFANETLCQRREKGAGLSLYRWSHHWLVTNVHRWAAHTLCWQTSAEHRLFGVFAGITMLSWWKLLLFVSLIPVSRRPLKVWLSDQYWWRPLATIIFLWILPKYIMM